MTAASELGLTTRKTAKLPPPSPAILPHPATSTHIKKVRVRVRIRAFFRSPNGGGSAVWYLIVRIGRNSLADREEDGKKKPSTTHPPSATLAPRKKKVHSRSHAANGDVECRQRWGIFTGTRKVARLGGDDASHRFCQYHAEPHPEASGAPTCSCHCLRPCPRHRSVVPIGTDHEMEAGRAVDRK